MYTHERLQWCNVRLQEAAIAARKRAAGMLEASTFMEIEASREAIEAVSADEAAVRAEQQYTAELHKELACRTDMGAADPAKHPEDALEQPTKVRVLPLHKVVPCYPSSVGVSIGGSGCLDLRCTPVLFADWPPSWNNFNADTL